MKHRVLSVANAKWIVGSVLVSLLVYCTFLEWRGVAAMHLLGYDYGFFYYAFQEVLHHQPAAALYQATSEQWFMIKQHFPLHIHNQYVYPPQFAVLLSPLGALSLRASTVLWMTISVISYALGIYWIASTLWKERPSVKRLALLFVCAAMLTPFQVDVGVGNVNTILFALIALTLYLVYRKQKLWLSGIPIGLAIVFKVTPAAALVYLMLRKQWRTSVSAVITAVVTTGITMVWLGPGSVFEYISHFVQFGQTSMKNGPAPYNQSFLGVLGMFVQHHWINLSHSTEQVFFSIFVASVALLITLIVLRTHPNRDTDIVMTSLTPLLFSPLVEEMHMVLVIPALLVLLHRLDDIRKNRELRNREREAWSLGTVVVVSAILMSLPVTFALNSLVFHVHQLFWTQTNMFWVLSGLFTITVVLALQDKTPVSHTQPKSIELKTGITK